jgi:hypothetical protein
MEPQRVKEKLGSAFSADTPHLIESTMIVYSALAFR